MTAAPSRTNGEEVMEEFDAELRDPGTPQAEQMLERTATVQLEKAGIRIAAELNRAFQG